MQGGDGGGDSNGRNPWVISNAKMFRLEGRKGRSGSPALEDALLQVGSRPITTAVAGDAGQVYINLRGSTPSTYESEPPRRRRKRVAGGRFKLRQRRDETAFELRIVAAAMFFS